MTITNAGGQYARLWVIMPVLHDVESFCILRERILSELVRAEIDVGPPVFVVVDDSAGADVDFDELTELSDVEVITPPFNLGHQRAIVFGLRVMAPRMTDHDVVVTMDADGEDRPEDVPRLLEGLAEAGDRLETGALALRVKREESLPFRLLYLAFRVLFRAMTGTRIRTGNFAAQRGWFIRNALSHPSFDLCYSTSMLALRRPLVFIPCKRGVRYAGQSRMNTAHLVAHGVRMMLPFAERIAVRFLVSSLMLSVVAVAVGITLVALVIVASPAVTAVGMILLGVLMTAVITFTGFLVLFSGSAHSSAIGMQGLEGSRG